MLFSCPSCETRYKIDDEKVRGRVLKIRCRSCAEIVTVGGGAAAPSRAAPAGASFDDEPTRALSVEEAMRLAASLEDAETRAVDAPEMDERARLAEIEWWAMIDGQQRGPLTQGELGQLVEQGWLAERSWVWRDGLGAWRRLGDVEELRGLLAGQPPADAPARTVEAAGAAPSGGPPPSPEPSAGPGPESWFDETIDLPSSGSSEPTAEMRIRPAPAPAPSPEASTGPADAPRGRSRLPKLVLAAVILAALVALAGWLLLPAGPAVEAARDGAVDAALGRPERPPGAPLD